MPFYRLPSGETKYVFQGTEFTGYSGPDDLVGLGEYSPTDRFNSGPGGVDTTPIDVADESVLGITRAVSLRRPATGGVAVANAADLEVPDHGLAMFSGPSRADTGL